MSSILMAQDYYDIGGDAFGDASSSEVNGQNKSGGTDTYTNVNESGKWSETSVIPKNVTKTYDVHEYVTVTKINWINCAPPPPPPGGGGAGGGGLPPAPGLTIIGFTPRGWATDTGKGSTGCNHGFCYSMSKDSPTLDVSSTPCGTGAGVYSAPYPVAAYTAVCDGFLAVSSQWEGGLLSERHYWFAWNEPIWG